MVKIARTANKSYARATLRRVLIMSAGEQWLPLVWVRGDFMAWSIGLVDVLGWT
jgi:hypothetical protein